MSDRVSLRGKLMLIRVDTLRIVHNVGFLVERLIYIYIYISQFINYLLCIYTKPRSGILYNDEFQHLRSCYNVFLNGQCI